MAKKARWTVNMFQREQGNWFSVANDNLYVDFMEAWAWTIRNIRYMGDEITGEYGAHGSVVCVKNREGIGAKDYYYIGTSHGFEKVADFRIQVEGNNEEYRVGGACSGKTVVVQKESNLGPLDYKMKVTFPSSGDCVIEKHWYKVVEDLNERFNYLFAFMHENGNAFIRWLAELDGGEELEGEVLNVGDGRLTVESDVKALILYSPEMNKGVVYAYPEAYRGADKIESEVYKGKTGHFGNSIVDRKSNNKLYFRPEVKKMRYKVGDAFEYSLKVIPFAGDPDEWKDKGRELAAHAWP